MVDGATVAPSLVSSPWIRRARYLGLPKTQLEHNIAAAAINMIRMDAYWTGHPLDRTRSSHLARLDFTLTA